MCHTKNLNAFFHSGWLEDALYAGAEGQRKKGFEAIGDPAHIFQGLRDSTIHKVNNERLRKNALLDEQAAHVNPAPEAPEPTAMLLDPAADVRNRRRARLFRGLSALRTPDEGATAPQY